MKTGRVCYFYNMKHIVLGTAGHVDHGKTALIKAITGVDTDRLKEEKERGISIELGFASMTLPNNQIIGIVDVPGHERFIKNMVSGASGIDMVVLVIAADEGVMPQTREHMQICSLLGIKKGLVALTKIDLVDKEWIDLVEDDIHKFLQGTFMEDSSIIPVSAMTGDGLAELMDVLSRLAEKIDEEIDPGIFRLSIDRVFTMRGFGTVVTGTLTSGCVKVGEEMEILPRRIPAKIRGIQIHNHVANVAEAGQRTAINLQGVEKATIMRGDVLARPHTLFLSQRFDLHVMNLPSHEKKIKNRSLVRFHLGTNEVIARMILLDRDEMAPGEAGNVQIILETPMIAMAGDRFILRSYSPVMTIGGGMIIDPLPRKHRRHEEKTNKEFYVLRHGADSEKIATIIERAGVEGIDIGRLIARTGLPRNVLLKNLDIMYSRKKAVRVDADDPKIVSIHVYQNLQKKIMNEVRGYHVKHPLREGILKEELRNTTGQFISARLFNMAIREMEKNGQILIEKENIHMAGHRVNLEGELEDIRKEIVALYSDAGLTPPSLKDIITRFDDRRKRVENILGILLKEGVLTRISEDLYFHSDVLHRLREDYKTQLLKDGRATPSSFKELTGLTRKFIIPLMEYFDMTKLTVRSGDHRILREREGK